MMRRMMIDEVKMKDDWLFLLHPHSFDGQLAFRGAGFSKDRDGQSQMRNSECGNSETD
jgi:hypothetical protein